MKFGGHVSGCEIRQRKIKEEGENIVWLRKIELSWMGGDVGQPEQCLVGR